MCNWGLRQGDVVVLSGLQNYASLNGRRGRVVPLNSDAGSPGTQPRVGVALAGSNESKSIKVSNLQIINGKWADLAEVAALASPLDIHPDVVLEAVMNWESVGVMSCDLQKSRVKFVTPFYLRLAAPESLASSEPWFSKKHPCSRGCRCVSESSALLHASEGSEDQLVAHLRVLLNKASAVQASDFASMTKVFKHHIATGKGIHVGKQKLFFSVSVLKRALMTWEGA